MLLLALVVFLLRQLAGLESLVTRPSFLLTCARKAAKTWFLIEDARVVVEHPCWGGRKRFVSFVGLRGGVGREPVGNGKRISGPYLT